MSLLVSAICAFAAAALSELEPLWRWNVAVLGLVLVLVGAVSLGVEYARARRSALSRDER
jgi:hypothetical protein